MGHKGLRGIFSHISHILQGLDNKVMHLFIIAWIAVSGHRFEQSIKVLIILHTMQQTSFHYPIFYLLFVHTRLHCTLPSVCPVSLYYVREQQQRRETQLRVLGWLREYLKENQWEIGMSFAFCKVFIGEMDLFWRCLGLSDDCQCLNNVRGIDIVIHMIDYKRVLQSKNYIIFAQAYMTKGQQLSIIGKRVNGSKISYHIQIGNQTQWLDYQELIDHLDLVIQYEKQRKNHLHRGINNRNSQLPKIDIQETDGVEESEKVEFPRKDVRDILFLEQKNNTLLFRVDFKDGSYRRMNNRQLRQEYPQQLIDFYENNILIDFS